MAVTRRRHKRSTLPPPLPPSALLTGGRMRRSMRAMSLCALTHRCACGCVSRQCVHPGMAGLSRPVAVFECTFLQSLIPFPSVGHRANHASVSQDVRDVPLKPGVCRRTRALLCCRRESTASCSCAVAHAVVAAAALHVQLPSAAMAALMLTRQAAGQQGHPRQAPPLTAPLASPPSLRLDSAPPKLSCERVWHCVRLCRSHCCAGLPTPPSSAVAAECYKLRCVAANSYVM
jgi:hypothetical protein